MDCYSSVGKSGIVMLPSSNPYYPSPAISNVSTSQKWLLRWFCIPAFATIVASYVHLVGPDRMIRNVQASSLGSFNELVIFGIVTVLAAIITSMGLKSLYIENLPRSGRMIGGTVFGVLLLRVENYIGVDQPPRFWLMIFCSALIATMIEWVWLRISLGVGKSAETVEKMD